MTLRVIANDDGWLMGSGPQPLTPEAIDRQMTSTWAGSPVDTVCWCVGNSEVYDYETRVGERLGDGRVPLVDERDVWARRNLDHLIAIAGGPLTEIGRQFRAAGLGFLPSARMNSHYAIPWGSPRFGRFRRERADCLIGRPDEVIPAPTVEHGIRRGLDYRHPAVREQMLRIVAELAGFDVDGVELDYMRHPAFFRVDEGFACRYLMTDFVRRVRQRLDTAGAERGRRLELLVRVPPTLADAARLGLDVRAWMQEGLVDLVVAGGGFHPFENPVDEFVAAARGTGCRVLGSLEGLRPCLDEPVLRALAARFWDAGADGLYLFNYYRAAPEWKRRVLGELVDRVRLGRSPKRYELDHTDRVRGKEGHAAAFHHAHPCASLPVPLEETDPGGGAALSLTIADDVDGARAAGALGDCRLGLGLKGWVEGDELEVALNGRDLPWANRHGASGWSVTQYDGAELAAMVPHQVEGTFFEFGVAPVVRNGANDLRVRWRRGAAPRRDPTALVEVRLEIDYR